MSFKFYRTWKKIKNDDGCKSKDTSSEDESEISVLLFEAIERREKVSVLNKYLNRCRINAFDELSNNCLHIAVNVIPYDLDVIKELLKHGVATNLPNWKKATPLHLAAENPTCDVDLIKVLLDNGAHPNVKNMYGDTPLHLFVMKCLKESNNDRNLGILRFLLENGARPNVRNFVHITPFLMAVHPPYCHLSAFVGRIKFEADFSVTRSNESLLDAPLIPSSIHSLDVIKLLLQYNPCLVNYRDRKDRTPMHIAVFGGASVDIVKELINKGADVNAKDEEGNTPLHVATLSSYSVIETLVKYGAEINMRNRRGHTPLNENMCPRLNLINPTAITALIELGADLTNRDYFHNLPLFYALLNNCIPPDVTRMLLEKRADPTKINFGLHFVGKLFPPPIYYCSDNQESAKIYIQFLLLYLVNKISFVNNPEKLMKFDLYGPALFKILSKFRDNCISELYQMKADKLNKDISLYLYVWEKIAFKDGYNHSYPSSFTKELLVRIYSNKYPCCRDLLGACIERNTLIDYLSVTVLYTSVQNTPNIKQSIILNYYSTMNLLKFLNKETLLSLSEVFSDVYIYKCKKKDASTSIQKCSKSGKFGVKRKHN